LSQAVTSCPRCQRRTPAARGECIYCGASLPISTIESAPVQRNIDTTELAFNAILQPSRSVANESVVESLALALQLEPAETRALIEAAKPIPVARSQTRQEAEMICALLRSHGYKAAVVSDDELQLQAELLRARRLVLSESEIQVTHSAGTLVLAKSDVRLMVLGELSSKRIDYIEGLSGGRGRSGGVLDSSEYRSEEMMLDVYADTLNRSFRIRSDAFDYSGLVSPLSFRADLNFKAAITTLGEALPHATVDENFSGMARLLERAWPERTRNETRGFKRTGLSFRSVAQASAISDNRDQFERYSRLMFKSLADKQG
jgi:hypothetical protein